MSSSTCAPYCGQWTDPSSRAKFDLQSLCGAPLVFSSPPFDFFINVCGRLSCAGSSSASEFCAVPKDSVCGIDPEAVQFGMVVRNSSEPCGQLKTPCARCDVLARVTDGTIAYSTILVGSAIKGVSLRLPSLPLTPVQRDGTDVLGGTCADNTGDASVADKKTVILNFLCECPSSSNEDDNDLKTLVNTTSGTSTTMPRQTGITALAITRNMPIDECTYTFDIVTPNACYVGFCEGVVPGNDTAKDGWLIALGLIVSVLLCLVVVRKRVGVPRLLGMTERFSRASSRAVAKVSGGYTGISETGEDGEGIGMGIRTGGDEGL